MSTVAFDLLAYILTVYVLLDGYDLGVATITPFVARSSDERAASMHAIGPYRNGNEVWLITAGAALFAFFPKAFASVFSGFYLPFTLVLWLLMFRGIAMELRGHFPSAIWRDFWDFCFSASSALLVLLFGVTLGNLLRGVPLDQGGYFVGTFSLLLNPFAIMVGLLAVLALSTHGALFLMLRVKGPPVARARVVVAVTAPAVFVLYVLASVEMFSKIAPHTIPLAWAIAPVVAIAALVGATIAGMQKRAGIAFCLSCVFLATLLCGAAAAMYPYLLPGYPVRATGLSAEISSPSPVALGSALAISIVGLCFVMAYSAYVTWSMRKPSI